jgi:hypothetical protein
MPIQPCPNCGRQVARRLESSSQWAHVNYYICEHCGHIWTISKDASGRVTHVTPLPEKPKGK